MRQVMRGDATPSQLAGFHPRPAGEGRDGRRDRRLPRRHPRSSAATPVFGRGARHRRHRRRSLRHGERVDDVGDRRPPRRASRSSSFAGTRPPARHPAPPTCSERSASICRCRRSESLRYSRRSGSPSPSRPRSTPASSRRTDARRARRAHRLQLPRAAVQPRAGRGERRRRRRPRPRAAHQGCSRPAAPHARLPRR